MRCPRRIETPAVRIIKRADREHLVLRWRDPRTGAIRERATTTVRRREAEREAAQLAVALAQDQEQQIVGWAAFRDRYEAEKLPLLRPKSTASWRTAANSLEPLLDRLAVQWGRPATLHDIDADVLSQFAAGLKSAGRSLATIASYIRQIRVALSWAESVLAGYRAPRVKLPRQKRQTMMRGRPITLEEFERLLAAVPVVLTRKRRGKPPRPPTVAETESWRHLLWGLWYSGLRLGEALQLDWTREDRIHIHRIDHRRPMLRIRAEQGKGGRDRLLPITPDFVAFLRRTPEAKREGPVFNPLASRGRITSLSKASHLITRIGREAKVVVSIDQKGRAKFASAHDLRRSFGERWAGKVLPIFLKELMRHESITTTERFYVGANAERTANAVWEAFGDSFGDLPPQRCKTRVRQES